MDYNLEIFIEMFPNIGRNHVKSVFDTNYSKNSIYSEDLINKNILDKLLEITLKQESIKEIDCSEYKEYLDSEYCYNIDDLEAQKNPCDINKKSSLVEKFMTIFSSKKHSYQKVSN